MSNKKNETKDNSSYLKEKNSNFLPEKQKKEPKRELTAAEISAIEIEVAGNSGEDYMTN